MLKTTTAVNLIVLSLGSLSPTTFTYVENADHTICLLNGTSAVEELMEISLQLAEIRDPLLEDRMKSLTLIEELKSVLSHANAVQHEQLIVLIGKGRSYVENITVRLEELDTILGEVEQLTGWAIKFDSPEVEVEIKASVANPDVPRSRLLELLDMQFGDQPCQGCGCVHSNDDEPEGPATGRGSLPDFLKQLMENIISRNVEPLSKAPDAPSGKSLFSAFLKGVQDGGRPDNRAQSAVDLDVSIKNLEEALAKRGLHGRVIKAGSLAEISSMTGIPEEELKGRAFPLDSFK